MRYYELWFYYYGDADERTDYSKEFTFFIKSEKELSSKKDVIELLKERMYNNPNEVDSQEYIEWLEGHLDHLSNYFEITGEEFVIDRVDINRADVQQLQRLEGIGPVLAQRIVEYRQEVNGFTVVEELLLVEGIGETTLENIREFIIIGEMK